LPARTDGLEVYPVGPRLAALLALGSYETTTPFEIERRMSASTRLELRLLGEEDEALADVRDPRTPLDHPAPLRTRSGRQRPTPIASAR
jgi:hypothetical protein